MLLFAFTTHADELPWQDLFANGLESFKTPHGDWQAVASIGLDLASPRKLAAQKVYYNGPKGRTSNLYTKEKYGDLEVHFEFLIPKGSNSGIKFHGHYEIQIEDSYGKTKLKGSDCGGIYPRADAKGKYTYLDNGIAPLVNACKPAGEWQSFNIVFLAPRFDKEGKKVTNARLPKVLFNGVLIHDNVELLTPTGDRWRGPEMSEGPLMIQAVRGPVALRNFRIRPLSAAPAASK